MKIIATLLKKQAASPGPAASACPVAAGILACRRAGLPSPADKTSARPDTLNHQCAINLPIRHLPAAPKHSVGGSFGKMPFFREIPEIPEITVLSPFF